MKIERKNLFNNHLQNLEEAPHSYEHKSKLNINKFHRAAIDGYVDMLCVASKRDTNLASDESGFTPTLLAANNGHLDALRILVGRGGDPERTTLDGSSALHLATLKNHLNCVSFLVNFGVNMWALNNELHTAKDIAAMEQRKEILEYLDQMMAKQSALNTKQVQKLKEKAKLAAEKRLKQMRKAQLKAIKQVEKDERFLVKLSHNRRLLKAAHSISDIRLVGRSEAVNYIPDKNNNNLNLNKILLNNSSNQKHLLSSTSIDLLGQRKQLLNFRTKPALSSASSSSTNSDNSSYSKSSVSSTSGYLSTSLSSASCISNSQPKYSDLVAVKTISPGDIINPKGQITKTTIIKQSSTQEADQSKLINNKSDKNKIKQETTQLTTNQSNSTIGAKLREISDGVSKKVKLKRMLLMNSSSVSKSSSSPSSSTASSSELAATTTTKAQLQSNSPIDFPSSCPSSSDSRNSTSSSMTSSSEKVISGRVENTNKLCNVQPAIKLKLISNANPLQSRTTFNQQQHSSNNQQQQTLIGNTSSNSNNSNNIKWPPAPSLSRANSEPNFGIALRSSGEDTDDEEGEEEEEEVDFEQEKDDKNIDLVGEFSSDDNAKSLQQKYSNNLNGGQNKLIKNQINSDDVNNSKQQQQHLLNQCLSQLKLRHEAITTKRISIADEIRQNQSYVVSKQPALTINSKLKNDKIVLFDENKQQAVTNETSQQIRPIIKNSSDELLKHQLNAGNSPLRPSIIKQQQQQQNNISNSKQQNNPKFYNAKYNNNIDNQHHQIELTKSTTTGCVDSIGSAGSLAQSNSQTSNSVKFSESSISPFSLSCSPSCETSSIEQVTTKQNPIDSNNNLINQYNQHFHHQNSSTNGMFGLKQHSSNTQMMFRNNNNDFETIETFLIVNGLIELKDVFAKEKIDLEALFLLSEEDLKSLNILLGPRRKLIKAIEDRRRRRSVTKPMYVMVDTLL